MNVKVGEFDMAQFKVYQENYSDVTVVSNIFIDEYMKAALEGDTKKVMSLMPKESVEFLALDDYEGA